MLKFYLDSPLHMRLFGEFVSSEKGWKHLTRHLKEYELFVVTQGTLYIADESDEYTVPSGGYLIMPPTRFQHGSRVCNCSFYWLHFCGRKGEREFCLPKQGNYYDVEEFSSLAKKIYQEESEERGSVVSDYLATNFLLSLKRQNDEIKKRSISENISPQKSLCRDIKEYIRSCGTKNLQVNKVAEKFGYNAKYLSALFHKEEEISLKQYILNFCLSEAKRFLRETDYTISEIGYFLNFSDAHNFSRFFKKNSGMTPQEYRRNKNNDQNGN